MIDFHPLLNPLIYALWYLIPLAILSGILKSPWFKGVIGEARVNLAARFFLDGKEYRLIKNVTLPVDGGTTQIDHVIVSRYGIFVIETKNMSGWIFGNPHQKTWTQKFFRKTYTFQNPLHQNYKHAKALETVFAIDPGFIFSVVVFVGSSTFKTEMPENVTGADGYIRYIKSRRTILLSESEAGRIAAAIESGRLPPSLRTHREHVRHLKAAHAETKGVADPACPKCGRPMVRRTTRKGANAGKLFWGCSGFPHCQGTRNA